MKRIFTLKTISPILVIMLGLGMLLYPKISDLNYATFQETIEAQTVDPQEEPGKNIKPLPKEAIAKITIPKINMSSYVLEGTSKDILDKATGHYEETPMPGEEGNSAIAGHRTMFGHPFRHLDKLEEGDEILIQNEKNELVYQVIEIKIVKPTDISVLDNTKDTRLTLTTCHPVSIAKQRLIVVAKLIKR